MATHVIALAASVCLCFVGVAVPHDKPDASGRVALVEGAAPLVPPVSRTQGVNLAQDASMAADASMVAMGLMRREEKRQVRKAAPAPRETGHPRFHEETSRGNASGSSLVQLAEHEGLVARVRILEAELRKVRARELAARERVKRLEQELRSAKLKRPPPEAESSASTDLYDVPIVTSRVCRAFDVFKRMASFYKDSGEETNKCPMGFTLITSPQECLLASATLFPGFDADVEKPQNSADHPRGCIADNGNKVTTFNTHDVGSSNQGFHLLCKAQYVDAGDNTNTCPKGFKPFTGMSDCLAAAGIMYAGEVNGFEMGQSAMRPRGCTFDRTKRYIFINTHAGVAADAQSLLCKADDFNLEGGARGAGDTQDNQ
eukprot:TRINITY_DN15073_c0_g1_i1.p1 TRINITY_DN15073_c0_g1~~TRINITY_DN15073_c0_g1_i1.p1  ORF type:complete len:373 (-),score=60.82 TRINITY_DN15073_c0_g1_i1:217-1335(-)